MSIIEKFKIIAKENKKKIVLPEGDDIRTIEACAKLINDDIAEVFIIGDEAKIIATLKTYGVKTLPTIINTLTENRLEKYIETYFELRRSKGITIEEATETMKKPVHFGAMMVRMGDVDTMTAGAVNTSAEILRAGLKVIGTKPNIKTVSSFIIIDSEKPYGESGTLFFADCAVNPEPNDIMLAEIALASANSWRALIKTEPKIAMLSFSTLGSASHPSIDKIHSAIKIVKTADPKISIDGEMQLDAAIIETVGKFKAPNSSVAGKANILIFPDLASANIGYKLTERFGHKVSAIGPILQGLSKPINDLSRGCVAIDIYNTAIVSIVQSCESSKA